MTSNARRLNFVAGALLIGAMAALAACGSDNSDGLKGIADGALAPESATMKWEQEIPATSVPKHIIRRFTSPESPGAVARFYTDELASRRWVAAAGNGGSYAEWSRDGMVISLVFESTATGSEWSLALFAAD